MSCVCVCVFVARDVQQVKEKKERKNERERIHAGVEFFSCLVFLSFSCFPVPVFYLAFLHILDSNFPVSSFDNNIYYIYNRPGRKKDRKTGKPVKIDQFFPAMAGKNAGIRFGL